MALPGLPGPFRFPFGYDPLPHDTWVKDSLSGLRQVTAYKPKPWASSFREGADPRWLVRVTLPPPTLGVQFYYDAAAHWSSWIAPRIPPELLSDLVRLCVRDVNRLGGNYTRGASVYYNAGMLYAVADCSSATGNHTPGEALQDIHDRVADNLRTLSELNCLPYELCDMISEYMGRKRVVGTKRFEDIDSVDPEEQGFVVHFSETIPAPRDGKEVSYTHAFVKCTTCGRAFLPVVQRVLQKIFWKAAWLAEEEQSRK